MPHALNRIWIHAIWTTKWRMPLITDCLEPQVYALLYKQFKEFGCPASLINGMPDHVHCLFMLHPLKSIAETIKQVKGSSSHEINIQQWCSDKFAWQPGYAAYSVSESSLEVIRGYISNQKNHHQIQPTI